MKGWGSVSFIWCPYMIALCVTKEQAEEAIRKIKVPADTFDAFDANDGHAAVTQTRTLSNAHRYALVYLQDYTGRSVAQIHALLAHEAVHVVLASFRAMGEDEPAEEQTAYAVQAVTEYLIEEFKRLTGPAVARK